MSLQQSSSQDNSPQRDWFAVGLLKLELFFNLYIAISWEIQLSHSELSFGKNTSAHLLQIFPFILIKMYPY